MQGMPITAGPKSRPVLKIILISSGVGLFALALGCFLTLLGIQTIHRTAYCSKSGYRLDERRLEIWGIDFTPDRGKYIRASEVTWVLDKHGYPTARRHWVTMSETVSSNFFSGESRTTAAKGRFETLNQCESIAGLHALFAWNKARGKYLLDLFLEPKSQPGKRIGATTLARFAKLKVENFETFWQGLVKEFGLRDAP